MIELRWLERNEPYMNFIIRTVRVLQYRQTIEVNDYSKGHYEKWSEWIDVPKVVETKNDESRRRTSRS